MKYEELKFWIDVAQFLLTAAIGIYIHWVAKHDAINKRISSLEDDNDKRLDEHATRIAKLEGGAITHKDLDQIKRDLTEMKAENSGQTALLKRLKEQFDLMNQWLVDRAK